MMMFTGGGKRKTVRRVATAAAAVALAAGSLAACSSGGSSDGAVSFWTAWSGDYQTAGDAMVDGLEAAGIDVDYRAVSNDDFLTALRTGLNGNNPPDVIQFEGYQQTRDFVAAGQLTDITDLWNEVKDNYIMPESMQRACEVDGKVYCIPWSLSTSNQLFYNPEMLEASSVEPPATLDDLYAAIGDLRADDVTPIGLAAQDFWPAAQWWYLFLAQRCGVDTVYQAIAQEDGVKWTDECFVESANDMTDLAAAGAFNDGVGSTDYSAMTALFASGRTAMMNTGTWYVGSWVGSPPPFDVGITPFPTIPGAAEEHAIVGQVLNVIGITSEAKDPEAARELVKYFTTQPAAQIWAENGQLSPMTGVVEQYGPAASKQVFEVFGSATSILPYLENELPAEVAFDTIYNGAAELALGNISGEEFMEQIQAAVERAE